MWSLMKQWMGKIRERSGSRTLEEWIWIGSLLFLLVGVLGMVLFYFLPVSWEDYTVSCWIHERSGLYCPGCGGTRAVFALLHGRIVLSFLYHPIVLYILFIYLMIVFKGILHVISRGKVPYMKWRLFYVYFGISIVIVQFLVKNIVLLCFHLRWMA